MGNLNFNANDVAPSSSFDPMPPGHYQVVVIEAEMVDSEKAGPMLKLTLEIDGNKHRDYAGRMVWANLCINHPTSDKAQEIAQRTLSALCHASGRLQIKDAVDLIGAKVQAKLKVSPARDGYDARNEVSGFRAIDDATPTASSPASAPPAKGDPAKAVAPAAKPAWKR